ncbi:MAG: sulfatase-like hydrolase/transferase, partial [Acidobacteriota bacterium]
MVPDDTLLRFHDPRQWQVRALCAALSVGLSLAFFDAASALLDKPVRYEDARRLFAPLAAATAFFFFVCLVAFVAEGRLERRFPRRASGSGLVAVAIFLCTFVPIAALLGVLAPAPVFRDAWLLLVAAVLASVSALAGGLAWMRLRDHAGVAAVQGARRWASAMPFIALVTLVYTWYADYRIPVRSLGGAASIGISALAIALILRVAGRVRRTTTAVGLHLSLVALIFAGAALAVRPPAPLNASATGSVDVGPVILLTVDTLRADRVGSHATDSGESLTPNLDRLGDQSAIFTNARSTAPWTLPSFASIFSGLDPAVHGTVQSSNVFPDALTTLAERLHAAGYRTAAIGDNPFLAPRANLAKGFESYTWFPRPQRGSMLGERLLERWGPRAPWNLVYVSTDDLTRFASNFLVEQPNGAFFLWLHYFDPHLPYAPPSPPPAKEGAEFDRVDGNDLRSIRTGHWVPTQEERRRIEVLYDAEVREVDDAIGQVLELLQRKGWYEDSLIVFASDHGEEFFEHGGFEHGHSVYDELLRVPLMIKLPRMKEAVTIASPVSL